jgi:hypothetical protein
LEFYISKRILQTEKEIPMSDIIALLSGVAIFTLLFLYVSLADRV